MRSVGLVHGPLRSISFVAVLLACPIVVAEPITFLFEGTVATAFDGLGALGAGIDPGSAFKGYYTFDSETPNTAPPVGEGDLGLYHHDEPPAGVTISFGPIVFRSVPDDPDFDIHVANDFGFAGTDEYGFISRNNEALDLAPSPPIDLLEIEWLATNFEGVPFTNADLPLWPPDLEVLGGGDLRIEGTCLICAGPASFFRIEGTLTSLELATTVRLRRDAVDWSGAAFPAVFDVLSGDLEALHDSEGDYVLATDHCVADDVAGASLPFSDLPAPGRGIWILLRPATAAGCGTYDSRGLAQAADRDEPIATSGRDCP